MVVLNYLLNFLLNDIFGVAAIFMSLIALVGLLLMKKSFSDIVSGVAKTALGVIILNQGVGVLVGSILPLALAVGSLQQSTPFPADMLGSDGFGTQYGTMIGIAMIAGFAINLLIARFTKFKTVFLTGHMLYWFPFVFTAVAVNAGFIGISAGIVGGIFSAIYYVVAPNLVRPYVKEVIGDDSFTLGHPSVIFALIGGTLAKWFGNKEKSTEDFEFPNNFKFLKEVAITGSIAVMLTYLVLFIIFKITGSAASIDTGGVSLFQFVITSSLGFGAGLTILMLGVRMLIAEITTAFTGIQEKLIPNAVPAYDCPLLFPYAPNAVILGFIIAMVASVIMIFLTASLGIFKYAVVPAVITCFFECGTGAVVGNAMGGRRGAIIAAITSGILLVFLMGFSLPFVDRTIADWMLVYGGQDFSLWAIIEGLILKIIPH